MYINKMTEVKKRGRKPKNKTNEEPKVHKKRGRRRKCDITSDQQISGFNESGDTIDVVNDKLLFSGNDNISLEDKGGERISFGNFNICVKKVPASETDELVKNLKDEQNNNLCDITIPEDYSDSSDNESYVKDKSQKYTAYSAAQQILTKKKKKNKSKGPIYTEEEGVDLTLVLEKFRGFYNEKINWPEETDIHCWWCCHQFKGPPKTLPYSYDHTKKRYKVMGIFCSWSCSMSYSSDDHSICSNYDKWQLTRFLSEVYGTTKFKVKRAPPRQVLKMFGGKMTIEEFRRNASEDININLNKTNCMLDPSVYFIRGYNYK